MTDTNTRAISPTPTSIAFIGFGEAGSTIAAGLTELLDHEVRAYDILVGDENHGERLSNSATERHVTLCPSAAAAIQDAVIVFSLVTADQCRRAAADAVPHLQSGQYWCDMNSTSANHKRAAGELVAPTGAHYIDAAVMDNVPGHGHKVPILLAGEAASQAHELLAGLGMNSRVIGHRIGQAATIKMCRSVFLKGMEANLIECFSAAQKAGVLDEVVASIDHTFPHLQLAAEGNARVTRAAQHAKRRAEEMRAATTTLTDLGMTPLTARATADRLQSLQDCAVYDEFLSQWRNRKENDAGLPSLDDIFAAINAKL